MNRGMTTRNIIKEHKERVGLNLKTNYNGFKNKNKLPITDDTGYRPHKIIILGVECTKGVASPLIEKRNKYIVTAIIKPCENVTCNIEQYSHSFEKITIFVLLQVKITLEEGKMFPLEM